MTLVAGLPSRLAAARPQQPVYPGATRAPACRRAAPRRTYVPRADPVDDLSRKAQDAASDAQGTAKSVASDAKAAAQDVAGDAKSAAKDVAGSAQEAAGEAKQAAQSNPNVQEAAGGAQKAVGEAKQAVASNPSVASAEEQTSATQGSGPGVQTPADAADKTGDNTAGVVGFIKSWPPKPITEIGQPEPENDPANFEGGKRVRGPSDEEVAKKRAELDEKNPFSKGREGGTQAGGGGEGSAS